MSQQLYTAPVVKSENVVLGVFGGYGCGPSGGGINVLPIGNLLSWLFKWFKLRG